MFVMSPTPRPLQLTVSSGRASEMLCLEVNDASPALHAFLRKMICQNNSQHEHYRVSHAAGAFLQGGSTETEGWILIEFWKGEDGRAQAFVDYVNEHAGHL